MNKFTVISDGIELDTYDNVDISLNYQIEDIISPSKRTTNYSKTIKLPGTSKNNRFFKQIFDVNIDTITFNIRSSIQTTIRVGEQQIFEGSMMLLNVLVNQNQVDYEVVVYGTLKNIIQEWGDLSLQNLDFSEYNHKRSISNITNSWNYNIVKNNVLTNRRNTGDGYVYPHIIYGNHTDINNRMYASLMFPAPYIKTIIDKAFDFIGFSYTSKFFESDYFKKLILPFTEDKLQLTSTEVNDRSYRVGVVQYSNWSVCPYTSTNGSQSFLSGFQATAISPLLANGAPWFRNTTGGLTYYMPFTRKTGTIGETTFQDPLNSNEITIVCPSTGSHRYRNKKAGFYNISLMGDFYMFYYHRNGGNIQYSSGSIKYISSLVLRRTNGTTVTLATTPTKTFSPSSGSYTGKFFDSNTPQPLDLAASNVYLGENDLIFVQFQLEYTGVKWTGLLNDSNIFAQAVVREKSFSGDRVTKFVVEPSNNTLQGKDDDITLNQVMPNIKISDFFVSLIRMFNLTILDNPNKPNDLIIEPRDDFYNAKRKVKDWTQKLDYNQELKFTPMSEVDARKYTFTYKEDDDYYNKSYLNEVKSLYGTYSIEIENELSQNEEVTEVLFSPSPMAQFSIGNRVAPYFCDIEGNLLKPKRVKPRILFYGGLKSSNVSMILLNVIGEATSVGTSITQYPYCGMWDDPIIPVNDLGFGTTKKVYFNTTQYPVNTLFEKFHKETLYNIIDINSKLLEAQFYLTPKDIAEFDFRDIILIDNTYWRITKIKDYSPVGVDKTTSVLLYKLNDVNIRNFDTADITISNRTCPTDLVQRKDTNGNWYYVSQSGLNVTKDCCDGLGAKWNNGFCYASLSINTSTTATILRELSF